MLLQPLYYQMNHCKGKFGYVLAAVWLDRFSPINFAHGIYRYQFSYKSPIYRYH